MTERTPIWWLSTRLFVLVGLLYMLGALNGFFFYLGRQDGVTSEVVGGGNVRYQIVGAGIYLITVTLILARLNRFIWLCLRNKALVLLVLLAALSFIWSIAPGVTLRRTVSLIGTTLFAFYLVMQFRPEELLKLIAWAIGLAAVASLVAGLAFPEIGTHTTPPHDGIWRGVFGHKNTFGRVMVLGTIAYLLCLMMTKPHQLAYPVAFIGLVLCIGLVIMSDSRTAWVTLAFLFVFSFLLPRLREGQIPIAFRFTMIGVLLVGSGLLLLLNLDILDRNITLSGRLGIWSFALEFGARRPLLGYGYRVFWTEGGAGSLINPGHSHNSFIDLWLDLGLVGVATFLATLAIYVRRAVPRLKTSRDPIGLWYPLFLAYMILTSITEETLLTHGDIEWVLYVAMLLYLGGPQPLRQGLHAPELPPQARAWPQNL